MVSYRLLANTDSEWSFHAISDRFLVPFSFSQSIQKCKSQNQTHKTITADAKLWLYIYSRYDLHRESKKQDT